MQAVFAQQSTSTLSDGQQRGLPMTSLCSMSRVKATRQLMHCSVLDGSMSIIAVSP